MPFFGLDIVRARWLRGVRVRPIPPLAALVAPVGLLAPLAAGIAWAVELRNAELVAAGSPVLQNSTGTVRLEDARLGRLRSRGVKYLYTRPDRAGRFVTVRH